MVNYVKRFIYVDANETRKVNPLFYPFLWATLAYGIGFFFFGFWSGVSSSSLHRSLNETWPWLPEVWGLALLVGTALCFFVAGSQDDKKIVRRIGCGLGMATWGYASLVYFFTGFYLVFASVGLLYLTFWLWFHFKFVKQYTEEDWYHLIPILRKRS